MLALVNNFDNIIPAMIKPITIGVLTALFFMPVAFQVASADTAVTLGSADITPLCGLAVTNSSINFGGLARDGIAGDPNSNIRINLNNTGNVVSTVAVSATNWLANSVIHIKGNYTTFSTSDQGNLAYASKTPLNNTNTPTTMGVVKPNPTGNSTFFGLEARLINLPFSGALTQTITFTGTC